MANGARHAVLNLHALTSCSEHDSMIWVEILHVEYDAVSLYHCADSWYFQDTVTPSYSASRLRCA